MNNAKAYTAQEMRYAADLREAWGDKDEVNAMLYYAAEMVERCERIKIELPFDAVINTANYILRGDAGNEGK